MKSKNSIAARDLADVNSTVVFAEPEKASDKCPLCRSLASPFAEHLAEGFKLRKCLSCGLAFHTEFSNDQELRDYYTHYYREDNLAFSRITEARFHSLVSTFELYRASNHILDVGCGSGHFLKVAIEMGWSAYGTEIASGAFDQLAKLGINSFCGKLESANYASEFFDVVYCSEVIEHLLDPIALLREIARILRPGGLLYLTTPNFNSLSRRLLASRWRVFSKEHICYFTPGSIAGGLCKAGFSNIAVYTRNIDPNEIRRVFSRTSVAASAGFQASKTEELRKQIEARRALKLARDAANFVLRETGTGDTIVVRAQK
jgi:2-polyprenyl-3-methyl-5-hydroxy-6-metoxy-1,4-benzoquinol methylase